MRPLTVLLGDLYIAFKNRPYRTTAIRVSLTVGSVLFLINHGQAVISGTMTGGRWRAGLLSYGVPFVVSLYSQRQAEKRVKSQ